MPTISCGSRQPNSRWRSSPSSGPSSSNTLRALGHIPGRPCADRGNHRPVTAAALPVMRPARIHDPHGVPTGDLPRCSRRRVPAAHHVPATTLTIAGRSYRSSYSTVSDRRRRRSRADPAAPDAATPPADDKQHGAHARCRCPSARTASRSRRASPPRTPAAATADQCRTWPASSFSPPSDRTPSSFDATDTRHRPVPSPPAVDAQPDRWGCWSTRTSPRSDAGNPSRAYLPAAGCRTRRLPPVRDHRADRRHPSGATSPHPIRDQPGTYVSRPSRTSLRADRVQPTPTVTSVNIAASKNGGAAGRSWMEANQRYLTAALALIRGYLEHRRAGTRSTAPRPPARAGAARRLRWRPRPALETLARTFGLSPFERGILLLCAGIELDSSFAPLCAAAQGNPASYPTFSLALAVFPDAHWSARFQRAVASLAADRSRYAPVSDRRPLRIDERVMHYLLRSAALGRATRRNHRAARAAIASAGSFPCRAGRTSRARAGGDTTWRRSAGASRRPVVRRRSCRTKIDHRRRRFDSPTSARPRCRPTWRRLAQRNWITFVRLWEREVVLGGFGLLVLEIRR